MVRFKTCVHIAGHLSGASAASRHINLADLVSIARLELAGLARTDLRSTISARGHGLGVMHRLTLYICTAL